MAISTLKIAHHVKATVHRVATVLPVPSALSVLKATSVQMTTLKHARKVAPRNAAKAAIHATNAGMTVAHAATTLVKPR
jgi:hypothetical protein